MKTGKNNRFLASILAASMMLTMSPFAFAAADTAEQKEMTTQEQVQPATQNETNANPTVSQTEDQSPKDTNSEALKTKDQSSEGTNSEASKTEGQPSEDVKPAGDSTSAVSYTHLVVSRGTCRSRSAVHCAHQCVLEQSCDFLEKCAGRLCACRLCLSAGIRLSDRRSERRTADRRSVSCADR